MIVTDESSYNAFPGLAVAGNTFLLAYRKGTSHSSDKGDIVGRNGTDLGRTWSSETTLYSDPTYDARDPSLTVLANGDVALTFFTYNIATGLHNGAYFARSTNGGVSYGSKVSIGGYSYEVAIASPVLELPNGDLLAAVYGRDSSSEESGIRIRKSTNGGTTWTTIATIAPAPSEDLSDPSIAQFPSGRIFVTIRQSPDSFVGTYYSDNSGVTWTATGISFPAINKAAITVDPSLNVALLSYRTLTFRQGYRLLRSDGSVTDEVVGGLASDVFGVAQNGSASTLVSTGLWAAAYSLQKSGAKADIYFEFRTAGDNVGNLPTGAFYGLYNVGDAVIKGGLHLVPSCNRPASSEANRGLVWVVLSGDEDSPQVCLKDTDDLSRFHAIALLDRKQSFTEDVEFTRLGVGTDPDLKLSVNSGVQGDPATSGTTQPHGTARFRGGDNGWLYLGERAGGTGAWWFQASDKSDLSINYPVLWNPNGGNVGIGTFSPAARLDVQGGGVVVGAPTGGDKGAGSINAVTVWRNGTSLDSVFEPSYKLIPIETMAEFVELNHHLPTIPTSEVNQDGSTNVGALGDRLWETSENHALYIIQLNDRIKRLEATVSELLDSRKSRSPKARAQSL